MRIVFFGTPDYVLPVLDALHKQYKDRLGNSPIAAVVTQPPMPSGRKQLLQYSAVDTWAHKKKIPVYFVPHQLITNGLEADLGVVASYGTIIPHEVLSLFPKGLLNIHPSKLPEFRGASPVQAQLVTGKEEAWVSIMKVDAEMDHGPIVTQFKEEILPDDTTETLRTRLFERSAEVLIGLIPSYVSGKIHLKEQDHKKAVYTKLIKKEDGYIAFTILQSALQGETLQARDVSLRGGFLKNTNKSDVAIPLRDDSEGQVSNNIDLWQIPFIYTKNTDGEKVPYSLEATPTNIERFIRALSPWPGVWTYITVNERKLRLRILAAHVENTRLTIHNSLSTVLVPDLVQLEGRNPVSGKQFKEAYPLALDNK